MKKRCCPHSEKDHYKGNVRHENYKDEMKQSGEHGQHRTSICKSRHCLHPLCDYINYQEGK